MRIIEETTSLNNDLTELTQDSLFPQIASIVAILIVVFVTVLFINRLRNGNHKTIGILFIVFLLGITFGLIFNLKTQRIANIIESNSFFIALIALIFSTSTYYSIDSVDQKNKMDNNILDTEHYTVAYRKILEDLNVNDQMEYISKFKKIVEAPKIKTCMQYSRWIQEVLDHIVFFVYLDLIIEGENIDIQTIEIETEEIRRSICKRLDKHRKYDAIGSRIEILLEENASLIKTVFDYQKRRAWLRKEKGRDNNNLDSLKRGENLISMFENIRGRILINPIARIVYHNYLGLDYLRIVIEIIYRPIEKQVKEEKPEEFTERFFYLFKDKGKDYFELYDEKRETLKSVEKCRFFLRIAERNFEEARKYAEGDFLWLAYIQYNYARVKQMYFLIDTLTSEVSGEQIESIVSQLELAIKSRENVCYMFSKDGFMKKRFEWELEKAVNQKEFFCSVFYSVDGN